MTRQGRDLPSAHRAFEWPRLKLVVIVMTAVFRSLRGILATSAIALIAAKRSLRYEQSGWRLHLNHKARSHQRRISTSEPRGIVKHTATHRWHIKWENERGSRHSSAYP
jgi:hypothetical protein